MTNAPASRKTHVIRILGTNKAGEVLQDIWVDVERIDEAKNAYQDEDGTWQGLVRKLRWLDDPDSEDYSPDGPASRKLKIVKVCSPNEDDLQDPEEWVPVPAVVYFRSQANNKLGTQQGKMTRLLNADVVSSRVVEKRRILHYDTNIDKEAQAAFDADPERKVYVVPGIRYERNDSTKDEAQYVEHEVVKYLKHHVNDETRTGSGSDQGKQTKVLSQYIIDESEEAKLEEVGENGFNPPYRLDPFQNIINVKWSGTGNFVIGCDTMTALHSSGVTSPSPPVHGEGYVAIFDPPFSIHFCSWKKYSNKGSLSDAVSFATPGTGIASTGGIYQGPIHEQVNTYAEGNNVKEVSAVALSEFGSDERIAVSFGNLTQSTSWIGSNGQRLIKVYNKEGELLWNAFTEPTMDARSQYGSGGNTDYPPGGWQPPSYGYPETLAFDKDNNLFVGSFYLEPGQDPDNFVLTARMSKYSEGGGLIWQVDKFVSGTDCFFRGASVNKDGDCAAVGPVVYDNRPATSIDLSQVSVFSASGNIRTFSVPAYQGSATAWDRNGNLYVAAVHTDFTAAIIIYNPAGGIIGQFTVPGDASPQYSCVDVAPSGKFYGTAGADSKVTCFGALGTDHAGETLWSVSTLIDYISNGVAVLDSGDVVASGYTTAGTPMYVILKGSTGELIASGIPVSGGAYGSSITRVARNYRG